MNYSLKTPLSCFLALSATAAMAAAGTENSLATLDEPLAVQTALPAIHVDVGGQQKQLSERVSLEGFWPLMQQEEQLLFLQGGWLRQQQRNLLSAGLGWRYFPEIDWGVGSNLFYDQDITRQHRRISLGAEAWWQSLTLSANGYLPASSWRIASDLKQYRERPAKGYDVTLKGYLPTLPHLGASVRYAHYRGDEVALSDRKHRQRYPKQWRWGLDVTPIPLLTLAYHQQPGLSGDAKHQFSAVLTYRFALPLSQQLDPTQVTVLHSAEGQRLARVQRERLMVLQYAKIAPQTPPKVVPKPPKVVPETLTLEEIKQAIAKFAAAMSDTLENMIKGDALGELSKQEDVDKFKFKDILKKLEIWNKMTKELLKTVAKEKERFSDDNFNDDNFNDDNFNDDNFNDKLPPVLSEIIAISRKKEVLDKRSLITKPEELKKTEQWYKGIDKLQNNLSYYLAVKNARDQWAAMEAAWTAGGAKSAALETARQEALNAEKVVVDLKSQLDL
ncbi:inverse autotransporter beta domain-containing protein [unidentified bacterial endosymbiont]|uniref:inverse autotransporter beta domain-containing protein n=1 Tax=unidentified bacterial endosymbiont TaxID=2355 RepID=UPI0020A0813F|nr:inverse autotransporter beta domain-containing protein [unidentified bacterial endosymbiont]